MKRTLLIAHGGGPTAVLNASLYGTIMRAKESGRFERILASRHGISSGATIDLTDTPQEKLDLLPFTPGSAIGTGRDHISAKQYEILAGKFASQGVTDILLTGGNDTMDTTRKLSTACDGAGILVNGIPKTMDNDLSGTDHTPGYGSAARYLAGSVREVAQDVKGLSIHVVVIEALGRDAGWIAASSAFARGKDGDGPDMILTPEYPFDANAFLDRVQELYDEKKGVIVVASEALKDKQGVPIVEPVFQIGRSVYYGDVSAHLSKMITKRLGIKSRNEKPGILGRASEKWVSDVDRNEAIQCGRVAVEALLEGKSGWMSIIQREESLPYKSRIDIVPISDAILEARKMPEAFLDRERFDVTNSFTQWLRPLVGDDLGTFVSFL